MDYNEFTDLSDYGHEAKEATKPEDEFFHSIYIAGKTRKNHINVEEQAGKFQVRGVEYNLDKIHMIITHTKEISSKIVSRNNRDSVECFSYKEGNPPFYGTTKLEGGNPRPCPANSAERATSSFCNPCRSQIIVAGIYCKEDGSPILQENKPIFVFIRGKGMKYSNVSSYLNEMFKMEIEPLFTPTTEDSLRFEKMAVNNKRHVTVITKGTAKSSYGDKDVFVLDKGIKLANQTVVDILKVAKKTKEKFAEKFDWSRGSQTKATGYTQGVLPVDEQEKKEENQEQESAPEPEAQPFSFEDIGDF
ncbi:MAG: hypothetical protein PVG65_05040 [Candidatus Thorarchaeota archaeon]|jgi:hypothetical protein